jgi:hypothetical protein
MRDPRVLFRKLSLTLPISISDILVSEISRLEKVSTQLSVLDLGAGSASYWDKVLKKFPHMQFKLDLMDAVAIESPASSSSNVTTLRIQGQVPIDLSDIRSDTYDLVVAFDLIEHLTKDQGYMLLYEIDRVSSGTSVVFTPQGFVWQPPSVNNEFNAHISGWTPQELKKLGWRRIRGHTGFQDLYGPYGLYKKWVKGWPLLELEALLKICIYRLPKFAFAFTATKRTKNLRFLEQEF